jgi:DNA-directed RNA polymerase subunit RPC12/RpoP
MDEFAISLLRNGILAAKEGDVRTARLALERVTNLSGDQGLLADAWFWMSETSRDPAEKRRMLETALSYDLNHAQSRRSLAILDGKLRPSEMIDPDHLPPPPPGASQDVDSERFTCPKCGGKMAYAPDGRSLVCDFCSRDEVLGTRSPEAEQDFIVAMATARGHRGPTRMTSFKCQGCGADFMLAPGIISAECTYCGSAHVVSLEDQRELIEPDAILPMTVTQSQAAASLENWALKNHLQPDQPIKAPRGLYLPVWSFDISGKIAWSGERMKNKKVVHIQGEDVVSYNDLALPASQPLAALLEKMLPDFDLTEGAPAYDPRYLAGWPAEVYQVSMAEASLQARQQASHLVKDRIKSKDGLLENLQYSTAELFVESFKLTLVPAWVVEIRLGSQTFQALVNGQSGKVQAEMPEHGFAGWLKEILDA